ncbi:MAG: M48 family metalloprotease [Lentisphaerae bacterium]|nr:M48 family metalloprotease [Lentisphaerota bacterium]
MIPRALPSQLSFAIALIALVTCCALPMRASHAQTRIQNAGPPLAKPPVADPAAFFEAMFEQFFGGDNQADRETIARVPVSVREEQEVGGRAWQAYAEELRRRRIKVTTRGKDAEYVQRLVEELHPRLRNADRYSKIRTYVADTPSTDAHSFPGGTLVFDRGLIDYAGSEAALVGIVGHELSHLDHGHQLQMVRQVKLAGETFSGRTGSSPERFLQNGALLMKAFLRPLRPEDETQADRDGATWAFESGYDPREFAALFLKLHERGREPGAGMPGFLRSHPYHLDRHRALVDLCHELQARDPGRKLYLGQENLRRRLTRAQHKFEE